jgi:hypothetical protein
MEIKLVNPEDVIVGEYYLLRIHMGNPNNDDYGWWEVHQALKGKPYGNIIVYFSLSHHGSHSVFDELFREIWHVPINRLKVIEML